MLLLQVKGGTWLYYKQYKMRRRKNSSTVSCNDAIVWQNVGPVCCWRARSRHGPDTGVFRGIIKNLCDCEDYRRLWITIADPTPKSSFPCGQPASPDPWRQTAPHAGWLRSEERREWCHELGDRVTDCIWYGSVAQHCTCHVHDPAIIICSMDGSTNERDRHSNNCSILIRCETPGGDLLCTTFELKFTID